MTTVYMVAIEDKNGDILDLEMYHQECSPHNDAYPAYESEFCVSCSKCDQKLVVGYACDHIKEDWCYW